MSRAWPISYQSLWAYLVDWCDYSPREATARVLREMGE